MHQHKSTEQTRLEKLSFCCVASINLVSLCIQFKPFYKYLSFVGGDVAKTYLNTATINKASQSRALNLKQTAWRRWGQTIFVKYEPAFSLQSHTEEICDIEKSKVLVKISVCTHYPWLLQVFCIVRALFNIYIFFIKFLNQPHPLYLCAFKNIKKRCLTCQSVGGFYSHSSLQYEKQVKPSYFRGIPKRIIHYLQRTSTAAMSQNIPSSEGVRTPTNLSKNHLLSGQIEAFPMHNLFHKHLLS